MGETSVIKSLDLCIPFPKERQTVLQDSCDTGINNKISVWAYLQVVLVACIQYCIQIVLSFGLDKLVINNVLILNKPTYKAHIFQEILSLVNYDVH